ncbi:Lysosomal protective protein [Fragariocoptes setiger]|uniref:Carboxypeptidase n=1 Tax=Fragariocoptes setiger TaxID=1670756 RepID=A0ABQ7SAP6_9ACAR|nr:Lysosomal protective protein [Fragariocoptes setiger]
MNRLLVSLAWLVFLCSPVSCGQNDLPPYDNPRRSAEEDLVTLLSGLNSDAIKFKHYSGYLKADESGDKYFHYWFVESESNPTEDPVVLWLNGGPGCSSMLGLFTELGPFRLSSSGKEVTNNTFSWNKLANVLFLESPAGVGYSYSVSDQNQSNDDTTAKSNHLALKDFFAKFPQFANNSLYLSGESYGGIYLPTLGVLVDKDPELNLKGIAIGNGYLHPNMLAESLVLFTYYHGLYGKTLWSTLSTECCDGNTPSIEHCSFTSPNRTEACADAVTKAADAILNSGINPYNLYDTCYDTAVERKSPIKVIIDQFDSKDTIANQFPSVRNTREYKNKMLVLRSLGLHQNTRFLGSLQDTPPCTDDRLLIKYLNRKNVRTQIHIPSKVRSWDECSDVVKYTMQYPSMAPQLKSLIASPRNLNLLVYNGDVDMMCNFLGDEFFCDSLGLPVISDYKPWMVSNQVAGYKKVYKGLTYLTVKGSGHMVPGDKPKESFEMIRTFLAQKN